MMTLTASNLLRMTDRAAFERLALHVLRFAEPDCASVIRLGTNEQGETVVSPLDGFAAVPGTTPPLYIAVESTTTDAAGLEKKWLYDQTTYVPGSKPPKTPPKDGDLVKAVRQAQALRQGEPTARFKVYLVTNEIVEPTLRARVDQVARSLNVECDVWEQSRIADYLDIDPTGQYLRLKYFGTPAERLSGSLLLQVSRAVHQQYAHARRVSSNPATWTARTIDAEVLARTDDARSRLVLLVGESGFGKTVAAYRAMETWLSGGVPALWIRADQLAMATSLHAAIDAVIRDRSPAVAEHSVNSLSLALGGSRLMVVVDDINRSQSPAVLLRKLLAWSATTQEVVILCPIWPRFLDSFHLADRVDVSLVRVGSFTLSEAETALAGENRQGLAAALHHDPFLIGIARLLAGSGIHIPANSKAREVLARFVDHELDLLQSGESGTRATHHKAEHRAALERTAQGTLDHLQLEPTADEARAWIADERLWAAMVEVLNASGIVWTAGNDQICYRHDRLRDHLLAEAVRALLTRGEFCSALSDPYFADIAAEALVRLGTPEHLAASLGDSEPLVLALALGVVDVGSDAETRLARILGKWFAEERRKHGKVRVRFSHKDASAKTVYAAGTFNGWSNSDENWKFIRTSGSDEWVLVAWLKPGTYQYKVVIDGVSWVGAPNSNGAPDGLGGFNATANIREDRIDARFALTTARARMIVRTLARLDSPAILDVARDLPEGHLDVLLARLRNGDVRAGIRFCQSDLGDPTMSYLTRASVIASVRRLHLEAFAKEFQELARDVDSDQERLGAIILAGHIGHPSIVHLAGQLWQEADARARLLPQALWAQLRSSEPDFEAIERLLNAFVELEEEEGDGTRISERGKVTEFMRLSGLRVGQAVVTWFLARMRLKPELEWLAWTLFARVDLPDAVEAMVRLGAKATESAREKGGFSLAGSMATERWKDKQMSAPSARRLEEIWQNGGESSTVRWHAFSLWTAGASRRAEALDVLRAVAEGSSFHDDAVHTRALLGDMSAEPAFAKILARTSFRAVAGSRIWGPNIMAAVDARLAQWGEQADDSYQLADLLTLAPAADAEKVLVKNWDRLRLDPRFVQAALAVGGVHLEPAVTQTIAEWPAGAPDPLEHAVLHLEVGFEDGISVPIDTDRIARLLPYYDRLGEIGLLRLGELCRKHGLTLWARERIGPLLDDDDRARVFPTPSDMKRELSALLGNERARRLRTTSFAELVEERSDGAYDPLTVLDQWLAENGTETALEIAAEVIVAFSRRSGVGILARHSDLSNQRHQQRLADVEVQVRRASL